MNESFVDYLTGLSNRRGLYDYYSSLNEETFLHAIYLDVDNFKRVNDIYGHSMGDEVIVKVSSMIKSNTNGFCCRVGGDEFVVLLDGKFSKEEIEELSIKYADELTKLEIRSDVISLVSLSIGIAYNQSVKQSLDETLSKCDAAMYLAKNSGKNQYRFYAEMDKKMMLQKTIELEMQSALESGQFKLYLQPEINMVTSQLYYAEALSRWEHPVDGIRLPETYLPVFEKNGFVRKLNLYLFEELCRTKATWKGTELEHLPVSFNISRLNLYDNYFVDTISSIAEKYEIDTKEIDVEIKEAIYLKDKDALVVMMKKLYEHNFTLSIDDYGNEFATLKLLRDMPVKNIKLSQNFLEESLETERGRDMFRNVILLCMAMRQQVIVVGVEKQEQADFILKAGCQVAQGNIYSKAIPAVQIFDVTKKYTIFKEKSYHFSFNGTLESEDKSVTGSFTGPDKPVYEEGIFPDQKAIKFNGGKCKENIVSLPATVLPCDSYTISMWIYPEEMHLFNSAFFINYETGFTSLMPLAWEGHSDFRMHLVSRPLDWFDASACVLPEKKWVMFSASYNAQTGRMFIFINSIALNRIEEAPIQRTIKDILVGGDIFQNSFKGKICNLRIFNEAKDYQFIRDLYKEAVDRPDFTKLHDY